MHSPYGFGWPLANVKMPNSYLWASLVLLWAAEAPSSGCRKRAALSCQSMVGQLGRAGIRGIWKSGPQAEGCTGLARFAITVWWGAKCSASPIASLALSSDSIVKLLISMPICKQRLSLRHTSTERGSPCMLKSRIQERRDFTECKLGSKSSRMFCAAKTPDLQIHILAVESGISF